MNMFKECTINWCTVASAFRFIWTSWSHSPRPQPPNGFIWYICELSFAVRSILTDETFKINLYKTLGRRGFFCMRANVLSSIVIKPIEMNESRSINNEYIDQLPTSYCPRDYFVVFGYCCVRLIHNQLNLRQNCIVIYVKRIAVAECIKLNLKVNMCVCVFCSSLHAGS